MTTIASEAELEAFEKSEKKAKKLTEPLKGVLQEVAVTGRIRYKWSLLRPLLEVLLEGVLLDFDAEVQLEVGPPRPLPGGETVQQLIERYKQYLSSFSSCPWTVQRLCELLLEPQKQYTRLHKVALALEKLLLVTSEMDPDTDLPPPPLLSALGPVNENPPPMYQQLKDNNSRKRVREDDGIGLVNAALTIKPKPFSAASDHTPQLQMGVQMQQQETMANGSIGPQGESASMQNILRLDTGTDPSPEMKADMEVVTTS